MRDNLNNCNFYNFLEGLRHQVGSYITFVQKMNGMFERQTIEKQFSNSLNSNIFNIKLHFSKAHTIQVVMIQQKHSHKIKQSYSDYKEECFIPFPEKDSLIDTDLSKDFQYFTKVLLLSEGTLSYPAIMKARRVCLIFCGLFNFLYHQMKKPSNLIKNLFKFQTENFIFQLKKISIICNKFKEFEHNLKSMVALFVEDSENELDNFITPKTHQLVNKIRKSLTQYYSSFSSVSKTDELLDIPNWISKEIRAFKFPQEGTVEIRKFEFFAVLLKILKKKIIIKSILSDLEVNKSSKKFYFRLLNGKYIGYDDNLVDILLISSKKNIFQVDRNSK